MTEKDAYIEHLENTIKDLQNQVSNLTEMVLLLRKEKFGSSSEKTTSTVEGQLSLFNEAEVEAVSNSDEPFLFRNGHVVKKADKTKREEILKDIPVMEIPCMIHPDDMFCEQCGSTLKEIGYVKVRDELEYVPAEYYDAMKSQFRQVGNHLTETGNHLLLLRVYSRKDLSNP